MIASVQPLTLGIGIRISSTSVPTSSDGDGGCDGYGSTVGYVHLVHNSGVDEGIPQSRVQIIESGTCLNSKISRELRFQNIMIVMAPLEVGKWDSTTNNHILTLISGNGERCMDSQEGYGLLEMIMTPSQYDAAMTV